MKLTILGSGTCVSGLPDVPNRYPPAFLVEWADQKMLFDCSEGVRFRLEQAGYEYTDIEHIAISHAHPDHNALVHFYQSTYVKGKWSPGHQPKPLQVYCPDSLAQSFNTTFWNYLEELGKSKQLYDLDILFHPFSTQREIMIGSAKLVSASVHHAFGSIDALSYRLETEEGVFVYSGDTGDCEGIREISKGADLFVCEASTRIGQDGKAYGHLNPYEAGDIAKQSDVKHLVLFHYQGFDSDEAMIEDVRRSGYQGEVTIGKDFQTFEF